MIKKTFKELKDIDNVVGDLYAEDKELQKTKFGYAYKRFIEKYYIPAIQKFNEKIQFIRIDNALEDPKTKELLTDTDPKNYRGYKYSKEGLKKCITEETEASLEYQKEEIQIEPFLSSFIPSNITEEQKAILSGVVIE